MKNIVCCGVTLQLCNWTAVSNANEELFLNNHPPLYIHSLQSMLLWLKSATY